MTKLSVVILGLFLGASLEASAVELTVFNRNCVSGAALGAADSPAEYTVVLTGKRFSLADDLSKISIDGMEFNLALAGKNTFLASPSDLSSSVRPFYVQVGVQEVSIYSSDFGGASCRGGLIQTVLR